VNKKEAKKKLGFMSPCGFRAPQPMSKSFLLLFFKKEALVS
jgi:hypothetical protein